MPCLEEAKTLGLGEVEYKNSLNESSDAVIDTTYNKELHGESIQSSQMMTMLR